MWKARGAARRMQRADEYRQNRNILEVGSDSVKPIF
jgi:hypothetical protein